MASWKKVIVSGSAAELGSLTLDTALAIAQGGTGAITAQASIDALTAVAGASAGQVLTKDDSGNATFQDAATSFTAAGISGSFTAASSSFSTRVTLNDAKLTANTTNVTNAGALMDSELTSITDVKALDQSVVAGASPEFTTTNMTDATNKRFMTDAQESKLDGLTSFTAAGISGSLGANAALIRSLTAAGISGSFSPASASFSTRVTLNDAKLTANTTNVTNAGALMDSEITNLSLVKNLASGIGDGEVLVSDGTIADDDFLRISGTSVEGRNATEIKSDLSLNNVTNESKATMFTAPTFTGLATAASLTISGDLNVAGSASFNHSKNLSVADKYILLNSGSAGANLDSGGIVIGGPNDNGKGELFGFVSGSTESSDGINRRWAVVADFDADSAGDFTAEAFMSTVTLSTVLGNTNPDNVSTKYKKAGNIFVDQTSGTPYIYV